jgi:CP family cyanate transporter-like MFS transporter
MSATPPAPAAPPATATAPTAVSAAAASVRASAAAPPAAAAPAAGSPTSGSAPHKPKSAVVFGVIALVLIGLNLRAGITGASALLHDLQTVLGYGPLVAAIIPSIPTLCFALAGAGTSWLTGKLGVEKAILLSLAMLAGGLLLRGIPATGMLVAGSVLGMSGLAVCNVAMPSFIREHFAQRTSLMTAVYTVTMTTGATVTAVAVVPLAQALGSPSAAIGAIGLTAVAAFAGFLPVALHAHRHSTRSAAGHISPWPLLRTRKGLLLTAIFTLQALLAYALLSWFPYMLTTMGLSAADSGLMFGLMQLVSVPAGMVLIAIGSRPSMLRPAFYLVSVTMAAGLALLLALPVGLAAVPAVLLGFGLGIFPLVMVMISRSGASTAETTALSTLAQSTGYLLATTGPFGMGLLHSATGGWVLPLALLLALALVQIVVAHLITGSKMTRTPAGHPVAAGAAGKRK